jgi:hypothetical protein
MDLEFIVLVLAVAVASLSLGLQVRRLVRAYGDRPHDQSRRVVVESVRLTVQGDAQFTVPPFKADLSSKARVRAVPKAGSVREWTVNATHG